MVSHVVRSGYGYANYLRNEFAMTPEIPAEALLLHHESAARFDAMLKYTAETLEGKWELSYEEMDAIIIHSTWGVVYNIEQLLEHAIVHILRHRRQIERLTQCVPS
jgi:uncharacterized damage-inducible protein DinB